MLILQTWHTIFAFVEQLDKQHSRSWERVGLHCNTIYSTITATKERTLTDDSN